MTGPSKSLQDFSNCAFKISFPALVTRTLALTQAPQLPLIFLLPGTGAMVTSYRPSLREQRFSIFRIPVTKLRDLSRVTRLQGSHASLSLYFWSDIARFLSSANEPE